jgi:hypothetical protein
MSLRSDKSKSIEIKLNFNFSKYKTTTYLLLKQHKRAFLLLTICVFLSSTLVFILEHTMKKLVYVYVEPLHPDIIENSNPYALAFLKLPEVFNPQYSYSSNTTFFGNKIKGTLGYHFRIKKCSKKTASELIKRKKPVLICDYEKLFAHELGATSNYKTWNLPKLPKVKNSVECYSELEAIKILNVTHDLSQDKIDYDNKLNFYHYSEQDYIDYNNKLNFWSENGVIKENNLFTFMEEKLFPELGVFDEITGTIISKEPDSVNNKGFKVFKRDDKYFVLTKYQNYSQIIKNIDYYEYENPMNNQDVFKYKNWFIMVGQAFKKDIFYVLIIGIQLFLYILILFNQRDGTTKYGIY